MVAGILDERKRKQDAKKRIEFRRLKNQMEADLQVRIMIMIMLMMMMVMVMVIFFFLLLLLRSPAISVGFTTFG